MARWKAPEGASTHTVPSYRAQLALLVAEPPTGPDWLHELKLDGYRLAVLVQGRRIRLMSRRGTEWTQEFPPLLESAKQLRVREVMIDGEVVMLGEHGLSSFEALQNRRRGGTLAYFAFDLMSVDGHDVSKEPLIERKRRLRKLLGDGVGIIRYTDHFDDPGPAVLRQACQLGAEGIVSKRRNARYHWGARHPDWRKSKCSRRQEFVVGGFTDPSGSRVGVGSMLLGHYEGDELRFAGKVGTGRGWSAKFGRELRAKLEKLAIDSSPFTPRPPGWLGRNAHWVRPKHVVEVEFTEWTAGGHVRHPSLQGFRTDKSPKDVVREAPVDASGRAGLAGAKRRHAVASAQSSGSGSPMVYPKLRVRRSELLQLYERIAEWALPHVLGRPLTVVRCRGPIVKADALRSQCTFVRHTGRENAWAQDVPRIQIPEKKKVGEYLHVADRSDLLALIENGVVEWHTWNARVGDVEHPDRIVFDLDPGEGTRWSAVVTAAREVRRMLERVGLESWPKTTGGRGLHVVVPFRPGRSWEDVFAFSHAVAALLVNHDPDSYTTSFSKADRAGKVLIDYKRNYRTSIAVAGFSPRARPDGTLSVPVSWREVTARLRPGKFTLAVIEGRLRRLRADPWNAFWTCVQSLPVGIS